MIEHLPGSGIGVGAKGVAGRDMIVAQSLLNTMSSIKFNYCARVAHRNPGCKQKCLATTFYGNYCVAFCEQLRRLFLADASDILFCSGLGKGSMCPCTCLGGASILLTIRKNGGCLRRRRIGERLRGNTTRGNRPERF